ncbi:MAG TPA: iron-containing alcohol dehydrogenase [Fibrobacteria bacterium]|nr:iron-containing alcohol dehydrogenase [Fibrobacteria bacterium]
MQQFNYPTTILFGEGALQALAGRLRGQAEHALIVTDATLVKAGLAAKVAAALQAGGGDALRVSVFDGTHPNPIEEDVEKGLEAYRNGGCDALIALGGGSPMDTAKVIRFMATHPGPLAQYDDAKGGDKLITRPMPPLFAIPTTSGTGSEVGRSGVIILRATGKKTIFFHPRLMPDVAVLEPALTAGLPPPITAATGIDAFTHCLEAYLANAFHPMADGIALEGIRLILKALPKAYADGSDLEARGAMQMAAAMGATAFQKGLGMIHSLAHPLSARYNTHHGLANALLLPDALAFLESRGLDAAARAKLARVRDLFREAGMDRGSLAESARAFFTALGVPFGLRNHKVPRADLEPLSLDAFEDTCHASNIIPVTREDLLAVYRAAY